MTSRPTPAELERLFDEHGIARRHLYPGWYRVHRWLGSNADPPVLYSLAQHFAHEGTTAAVILLAGGALLRWHYATDLRPLWPILLIAAVTPLWNWLTYRRIRRRIGLQRLP